MMLGLAALEWCCVLRFLQEEEEEEDEEEEDEEDEEEEEEEEEEGDDDAGSVASSGSGVVGAVLNKVEPASSMFLMCDVQERWRSAFEDTGADDGKVADTIEVRKTPP